MVQATKGFLDSTLALRTVSVLFGVMAVALLGVAARVWLGHRYVLPVMLVAAIHPALVYLEREARPYAMEHMFAALALVGASPRVRQRTLLPVAIGVAGTMLSTYSSWPYCLAIVTVVGIPIIRRRNWRRLLLPAATLASVAAFVLVYGSGDFAAQAYYRTAIYNTGLWDGVRGLKRFVFAVTSLLFGNTAYGAPLGRSQRTNASLAIEAAPFLAAIALVVLIAAAALYARWSRHRRPLLSRPTAELAALTVAPFLMWSAYSVLADGDFRPRYFTLLVLPMSLLLVRLLSMMHGVRRDVLIGGLIALAMISNFQRIYVDEFGNPDYRSLADHMTGQSRQERYYFFPGSAIEYLQEYQASLSWLTVSGGRGPYGVVDLNQLRSEVAGEQLDLTHCESVFITNADFLDPDGTFVASLRARGAQVTEVFSATGIVGSRVCGFSFPDRDPNEPERHGGNDV